MIEEIDGSCIQQYQSPINLPSNDKANTDVIAAVKRGTAARQRFN